MRSARLRDLQLVRFLANLLSAYLDPRRAGQVIGGPFPMRPARSGSDLSPAVQVILQENARRLRPTHVEGPADVAIHLVGAKEPEEETARLRAAYAKSGVPELWVIDGERCHAGFYRLTVPQTYELVALPDPPLFRSTVLPGFYLPLDLLWRDPLPTLRQTLELALWMTPDDRADPNQPGMSEPAP